MLSNATLEVDEGVADDTNTLCVTLDITGGGTVQCELTVTLGTSAGTASKKDITLYNDMIFVLFIIVVNVILLFG